MANAIESIFNSTKQLTTTFLSSTVGQTASTIAIVYYLFGRDYHDRFGQTFYNFLNPFGENLGRELGYIPGMLRAGLGDTLGEIPTALVASGLAFGAQQIKPELFVGGWEASIKAAVFVGAVFLTKAVLMSYLGPQFYVGKITVQVPGKQLKEVVPPKDAQPGSAPKNAQPDAALIVSAKKSKEEPSPASGAPEQLEYVDVINNERVDNPIHLLRRTLGFHLIPLAVVSGAAHYYNYYPLKSRCIPLTLATFAAMHVINSVSVKIYAHPTVQSYGAPLIKVIRSLYG